MELELVAGKHLDDAYKILASLVVPRPIAWVSTIDENGVVNLAPFSFFNVFGDSPPMLAFAPGDRGPGIPKDTARNIRQLGEFVVNLVDEKVAEVMNQSSAALPHGISELEYCGLHAAPSRTVRPPRVAESPVALECREHSTIQIGENRLVIGIVQHVYVRDDLWNPDTNHLRFGSYHPIGRMASPNWYVRCHDQFQMDRP